MYLITRVFPGVGMLCDLKDVLKRLEGVVGAALGIHRAQTVGEGPIQSSKVRVDLLPFINHEHCIVG